MSVEFRIAEPRDAAGIQAVYGPYCETSPVSFEVVAPSVEQMRGRIARITAQYPWLLCESDSQVSGYVYASQHRERAAYRWAVEVAVYVANEHQRRGVGQALYSVLFDILRAQGYFKAYAGITLPNPGSVGLHEAVGFKPIAVYRGVGYKLGTWIDVGWWQLDLQPEIANPPEPIPFTAIRASESIAAMMFAAERLIQPRSRA